MPETANSQPIVLVISLGGTIAMTPSDSGTGVTPTLEGEDLVAAVPDLRHVARVRTLSFRRLPGAHLAFDDVFALSEQIEKEVEDGMVDGVVVTQGTDTIEETAFLLELLISCDAPVVITGAMRPPTAVSADGPANLLASVQVAANKQARGLGALVVFNNEIHGARFVQKTHPSSQSAFTSAPGPLGWVSEGEPRILLRPARSVDLPARPTGPPQSVALITVSLDDDGRILRAVPDLGFSGVVVEALGGGHVPSQVADEIARVIDEIPVVLTSRTGRGEVLRETYDFPGSETDLRRRGAISAGWLDGPKARGLLTVLLRAGLDRPAIAEAIADVTHSGFARTVHAAPLVGPDGSGGRQRQ
jgi:L-asparaginase